MDLEHFFDALSVEIGEDQARDTLWHARMIVDFGFMQWPWYRVARARILGQEGREDLIAEVMGEIVVQKRLGLVGVEAETAAQALVLKRLRSQYSFEYGQNNTSIEEQAEHLRRFLPPGREEMGIDGGDPRHKVEFLLGLYVDPDAMEHDEAGSPELLRLIQETLTDHQLEVAETVASVGSNAEAARLLGLGARQQVRGALTRARKRLEAAGITP